MIDNLLIYILAIIAGYLVMDLYGKTTVNALHKIAKFIENSFKK